MSVASLVLDGVLAVVGGCLGAILSALGGFLLFGLLGLVGLAALLVGHDSHWIGAVAGSVLLKPHVCFLGGVVAAAVARRRGLIRCGKDIGRPVVALGRPELLLAGGGAGLAGHLLVRGLDTLWAGRVDTVALAVCLIPALLKRPWGLTVSSDCDGVSHAVPSPYRFFERVSGPPGQVLLALAVGVGSALAAWALFRVPDARPYAALPVFFLSAVSLFPAFLGGRVPTTHHLSGPAGAVAALWLSGNGDAGLAPVLVALWGGAAAQCGLLAGAVLERRFFTDGDIHVDPPAMGIAGATALLLGLAPQTGVYRAAPGVQALAALALIALCAGLTLARGRSAAARR